VLAQGEALAFGKTADELQREGCEERRCRTGRSPATGPPICCCSNV
jgi:hypothetical protein